MSPPTHVPSVSRRKQLTLLGQARGLVPHHFEEDCTTPVHGMACLIYTRDCSLGAWSVRVYYCTAMCIRLQSMINARQQRTALCPRHHLTTTTKSIARQPEKAVFHAAPHEYQVIDNAGISSCRCISWSIVPLWS